MRLYIVCIFGSYVQEFSKSLGKVVDIVVSHQGLPTKMLLVSRLMSTLVLPAPEHYRPLLRRFAALGKLFHFYVNYAKPFNHLNIASKQFLKFLFERPANWLA